MPSIQMNIHGLDNVKVEVKDFPKEDGHAAFAVININEHEPGRELSLFFKDIDSIAQFHSDLAEALYGSGKLGERSDGTFAVEKATA